MTSRQLFLRHLVLALTLTIALGVAPLGQADGVSVHGYQWAKVSQPLLSRCANDWHTGATRYDGASTPYQLAGGYALVIDRACRAVPPAPRGTPVATLALRFAAAENRWLFDVTTGDVAAYHGDFSAVDRLLPALQRAVAQVLSGRPTPAPRFRQTHVVAHPSETGIVAVSWTAPSGVVQSYEVLLATPAQFAHYLRTGAIAPAVDVTGLSPTTRHYVVSTLPKSGDYVVVVWAHVSASTVVTPLNYPRLYLTTGTTNTTTTTTPIDGGPLFMPTTIYWDSPTTATVTFTPTPAALTTLSRALSEVNTAALGTGQTYGVRLGIVATTNGGSPATCSLVGTNHSSWLHPQTYFCRSLHASLSAAAQYSFASANGLISPHKVTFKAVTSNDNLG